MLILPNPTSLSARAYGPLAVVWDAPRHLSLPSADAVTTMLQEAGFRDVTVRTSSHRARDYSAIARGRAAGIRGPAAWRAPSSRADSLLQAAEAILVRLGLDVGEEMVVGATAA